LKINLDKLNPLYIINGTVATVAGGALLLSGGVMMKKVIAIAAGFVAVMFLAFAPVAASAQGCGGCKGKGAEMKDGMGPHGHHHGHKKDFRFWKCPKASAELKLTPEQIKKLDAADEAAGKKMDAIRDQLKTLKAQKHDAMKGHPVDRDKVMGLVAKVIDLKSQKMKARAEFKLEAFGILTKDQKLKLDSLRDEMMPKGPGCDCGAGCGCKDGDKGDGKACNCGCGGGCGCDKD